LRSTKALHIFLPWDKYSDDFFDIVNLDAFVKGHHTGDPARGGKEPGSRRFFNSLNKLDSGPFD